MSTQHIDDPDAGAYPDEVEVSETPPAEYAYVEITTQTREREGVTFRQELPDGDDIDDVLRVLDGLADSVGRHLLKGSR